MPIWGTGIPKRPDGRTNNPINATPTYGLPSQISGLSLWFDAADTSTIRTNISSLNQWFSKTSISTVMSNAFGLPGPTWVSTAQNGLPVVRFRGENSTFMSSFRTDYPSSNFVSSNETTIFLAYNPTNFGAPFGVIDSASYGGIGVRLHPQCGQTWFFGNINSVPQNARLDYSYSVNTGFKVETYIGRQSTLAFRNNGSLYAASTMLTGLSFPNQNNLVFMGGLQYNARLFTQDIGEAILYNRGLSDAEILNVEAYLAAKWGVRTSMPFNHPARIVGPPIAGYRLLTYRPVVSNYGLWYDAMDTSTIRDIGGNFPPLLPPNQLGVGQWNDKSGNNNRNLSNFITNPSFFNLLGTNFYPNVNSPGFISNAPLAGYYNLRQSIAPNSYYIGCNISAFFVFSVNPINAPNGPIIGFTSSFSAMPRAVSENQLIINSNSTFDFNLSFNGSNIGLSRFGVNTSNNLVSAPYFGSTSLISVFVNGTQNTIGNVLPSTNLIEINGSFVSSSSFYAGNNFNFQYLSLNGIYNQPTPNNVFYNEIAVFFRTLTTPERTAIETQLIRKWGLPSNLPITLLNQLPTSNGLFGWYDAYDPTTVLVNSSNNVSMWLDKSGQNNHMSTNLLTFGSNTGSNIYYSTISISTNQFPSLFFPSTFAFMQTSTLITNQSLSTFTILAVKRGIKIPLPVQVRTISFFSTLSAVEIGGAYIGAQADAVQNTITNNSQFTSNYSTFHINTLMANTFTTTINGVSSTSAVTFYNGRNSNVIGGINYNGMWTPSYIRLMASAFSDQINGDQRADAGYLGEVLLYNRILDTNELDLTHRYLLNKWGISTLVSNVPVTSGLNLWLDAYDPALITLSTNSVIQWRDKSGCNFHFSNSLANGTSLLLPTYTTNPVNNLPSLLFSSDGNTIRTTIYNNTNFNFNTLYDATAFVVFQQRNQVSAEGYVFTGLFNGENEFNNGNGFVVKQAASYISLTRSSIGVRISGINTRNPTLTSAIFNSSFATTVIPDIPQNNFAIGRNGVIGSTNISSFISSLSLTYSSIQFNMKQAIIGSRLVNSTDFTTFFDGYMHEILLYNRTLSFVERQQVESYLMSKWNI